MCNCMDQINSHLAEHNTRLGETITFSQDGSSDVLPSINTEKIESRKRGRPLAVLPTYCPFCGEKYPKQP